MRREKGRRRTGTGGVGALGLRGGSSRQEQAIEKRRSDRQRGNKHQLRNTGRKGDQRPVEAGATIAIARRMDEARDAAPGWRRQGEAGGGKDRAGTTKETPRDRRKNQDSRLKTPIQNGGCSRRSVLGACQSSL